MPGVPDLDPVANAGLVARLTELVVIISLMGAGSKLDRPFDPRSWSSTWRYLSYALAHASFRERELVVAAEELWALVGFVVLASIVLHGISASPVMDALDRRRGTGRARRSTRRGQ